MVWNVRRYAAENSRHVLIGVFLVSLFLFAFFAYSLYRNDTVLLSPTGYGSERLGLFFIGTFFVGLVVTLIVMIVILYIFFHNSESRY